MKWTSIYFVGYIVLLAGLAAALWKVGILEKIGPAWTTIGVVIAVGAGIMLAVSRSSGKQSIEIEK